MRDRPSAPVLLGAGSPAGTAAGCGRGFCLRSCCSGPDGAVYRADDCWWGVGRPARAMPSRCSGPAVPADRVAVLLAVELAPVVHKEAAHAGELVGLAREHPDRQLLVRE